MYRYERVAALVAQRIVGIVRAVDAPTAFAHGRTLIEAGVHTVEITLTGRDTLTALKDLVLAYPKAHIGAGTVLDGHTANLCVHAGAQFVVSPGISSEVITTAHRYGLPAMVGASTPTEVIRALEGGADLIKVFPASTLTPAWLRAVLAALPQAPLVPTGGLRPGDVAQWLAVGSVACGLGSDLVSGSPAEVTARVDELLRAVVDA